MLSVRAPVETKTRYDHLVGPVYGSSTQPHVGFICGGRRKERGTDSAEHKLGFWFFLRHNQPLLTSGSFVFGLSLGELSSQFRMARSRTSYTPLVILYRCAPLFLHVTYLLTLFDYHPPPPLDRILCKDSNFVILVSTIVPPWEMHCA